jgi:hypothetical protein
MERGEDEKTGCCPLRQLDSAWLFGHPSTKRCSLSLPQTQRSVHSGICQSKKH